MIGVPTPISEGVPYCVDALEVTNAEYAKLVQPDAAAPAQPAECAWNDDLSPPNFNQIAKDDPDLPVVNVDWCDAWTYCASVGKRLCGKLGGGGHPYTLPQSGTNEWYVACSAAGSKTYVYGSAYDSGTCVNVDLFDASDAAYSYPVGSFDTCVGGYPGLYDMNGNVWEWEQSCNDVDGGDASVTQCRRRGGSFTDNQSCSRCSTCGSASRSRSNRSANTGIRCCAG
jgi:formylglycine-generating enzyme required for sulfatase activity